MLTETVQVNYLPEATVSYAYDGLGRLSSVTYGNGVSESRTYTVQGWLKEIEAGTASGDAVFRETLRYWENGSTSSLYSGMVSGTSTQNGGPSPLDYDYVYDYLWRILRAGPPASDSWGEKGISYDRNSNLRSLTRYGGDGSVTDMLNMSYSGNVLSGVTRNGVTKLYSHDVGGRLTEDGRTGVSVSYDVTGMPETTRTSVPGGDVAETFHSYLSDGTRLGVSMNLDAGRLQVRTGYVNYGSLTFREIGGQQSFESSLFGGGVILSDGVRYFTRDHLGNTRVVTDGSGNVVERDDYYPFGERHEDSSMPTTATNRWRFAGKEIQPLGSTGWIDFGARQYDSFLGRWTTVDPLAEKYPGISPYLYCAGNPVNYVDPDGRDWKDKLIGYCIGVATNIVPGTSLARDVYTPSSYLDYNIALQNTDRLANSVGQYMTAAGIAGVSAGVSTGVMGSQLGITVVGAPEGVIAFEAGTAISVTSLKVIISGTNLMYNSEVNANQGYDRGNSPKDAQRKVRKGQAPKDISRIDSPNSISNSQWHAHGKDGSAINIDGTVHDKHRGDPSFTKRTLNWLQEHGWNIDDYLKNKK